MGGMNMGKGMGMFYPQYFMRSQEAPKVLQLDGLPPEVLQAFNVEIKEGEKTESCWRLKDAQQSYALWPYAGDHKTLESGLQWQKHVTEQGFSGFVHLYKTKAGGNYFPVGENAYYLTDWCKGAAVEPQQEDDLLKMAETLSELHFYSHNAQIPVMSNGVNVEISWLKAKQEKLTELLTYYQYLKEQRLVNDYERLYLENFEDFYRRGQEAIQKMALAGVKPTNVRNTDSEVPEMILLGNLLPHNFLKTEKGLIILQTTKWKKGPRVAELALFLKMYLPLKQWDGELARALLTRYQAQNVLQTREKWLLLAQLAFPGRFWLYTYQYLCGYEDLPELTVKFKQYLYEVIYLQEQCLENLENWLLESETE